MNGRFGSGMTQPTSMGMKSGCATHATTKKRDISVRFSERGEASETMHDVSRMV
jgi:hypothetical protein